jgi:protein phosphatase
VRITIPDLSLVLLVGPSGCGKSTFARRHFLPTEIVSSDHYRAVVTDDESAQHASRDAFELVHHVVEKRLLWKRFTVVDATNLKADGRKPLLELARRFHYLVSAIVFDLPEELCQQHNAGRTQRVVPAHVVTTHANLIPTALTGLQREGVRRVHVLRSAEEIASAAVERVSMRFDQRQLRGPFDVIGDVHGCAEELLDLFARLGYRIDAQPDSHGLPEVVVEPPPGRTVVFVGDLGDRGPDTPGVYRIVMPMVRGGRAFCVLGNHDNKLLRKLRGSDVAATHGFALTLEQLDREPHGLKSQILDFLEGLPEHFVFDDGRLVVAHGGLLEDLQGRASGRVRSFALFGDTTGQTDEHGMPVRLDWAADYKGRAAVVYGHTPVAEPVWRNNTINIDTGCVFGGRLTALRYPEREIVSVPARRQYCEPARAFLPEEGEGSSACGASL